MAIALELDDEDDGDHGEAEDDGVGHAVERVDPPVVEKLCDFRAAADLEQEMLLIRHCKMNFRVHLIQHLVRRA